MAPNLFNVFFAAVFAAVFRDMCDQGQQLDANSTENFTTPNGQMRTRRLSSHATLMIVHSSHMMRKNYKCSRMSFQKQRSSSDLPLVSRKLKL